MRTELAKGKDLDKPFYEQRSKRSPYNLAQQNSTTASFSSRIGVASRSYGGGTSGREDKHGAGRRGSGAASSPVKNEREREDDDPKLAYSDWLDMSALGDDGEENDGDGDEYYDISDAEDDEDDDDEEDEEDEDSDGDYMEE